MLGLAFFLAAASWSAPAPSPASWDVRISSVEGSAQVQVSSPVPGSVAAMAGMPLEGGDQITTGPGASVLVSLSGRHLLRIGENSQWALASSAQSDASFKLSLGGMMALIEHLLPGQSLSVDTPQAVMAVRGTEFGVELQNGRAYAGVFDSGRLEVRGMSGEPVFLAPGQESSVFSGRPPAPPRALERLAAYRRFLARLRRDRREIRRTWRPLALRRRLLLRRRMLRALRERRMRLERGLRGPALERRRMMQEKMRRMRQEMHQRRPGARDPRAEMERRRAFYMRRRFEREQFRRAMMQRRRAMGVGREERRHERFGR